MKSKKGILTMLGYAILMAVGISTCNILSADDSVTDFSSARTFQGTATPIIQCNLLSGFNDDWRGMIIYTKFPGDIFKGPTKDVDGKVLNPGTILFKIDKEGRQVLVDQYAAGVVIAKENYERDLKLLPTHSISEQQFEADRATYMTSIALLKQEEYLLNLCTIHAPFDGVVISVNCVGWLSGEPAVMQIAQLVPMGIQVPMSRELANKITPSTPITIYPDPSISKEPFGISRNRYLLTDKGITFMVVNYQVPSDVTLNGEKVPVVYQLDPVIPFAFQDTTTKSVDVNSIFKDNKGTYVWLAVGQKDLMPKGIDKIFPVKKVYVELGGKSSFNQTFSEFVAIKPNDELKIYDSVLEPPLPKNLKDGDKVTFQPQRYIFMPGDDVKVIIGPEPAQK